MISQPFKGVGIYYIANKEGSCYDDTYLTLNTEMKEGNGFHAFS